MDKFEKKWKEHEDKPLNLKKKNKNVWKKKSNTFTQYNLFISREKFDKI